MLGARRIAAVWAVMAGLVIALVCVPSQAATVTDPCTTGCTTTTTGSAAPVAATGGATTISSLTGTNALLSAYFNPGSEDSPYYFQVLSGTDVVETSPQRELDAPAPNTLEVFIATGLQPNTDYSARIVWSDETSGGATVTGASTPFHTPVLPAAVPHLTPKIRGIEIGEGVTLRATATLNPFGSLAVLDASDGSTDGFLPFASPGTSAVQTLPAGRPLTYRLAPTHNTRFRVRLPGTLTTLDGHRVQRPSVSNAVSVYVFPASHLSVSRPQNNAVNEGDALFTVDSVPAGFHGEDVYFYASHTAKGAARLVGRAPLEQDGPNRLGVGHLLARLDFTDPHSLYLRACVVHRVVPDMGVPFTDPACGRPTLAYGAR